MPVKAANNAVPDSDQRIEQCARGGEEFHPVEGRFDAQEVIDQRGAHSRLFHMHMDPLELVATTGN
jgi:hypothetical protein